MRTLVLYCLTLILFVGLDALWLGLAAKRIYLDAMGPLMRARPDLGVAAFFYLLIAAGIVVFAAAPGLEQGSVQRAALMGALLGLVCYATYDLTALAVIRDFPRGLAFLDLAWGTLLTSVTAASAVWLTGRFGPAG